jgi:hypothetical protein
VKSVSQISDRAKRYRANRVHTKRKRCEECGSKRNLGVGHRDGDEANNRPSNLFTQCKSCNGKQAARDKRMGRGVRTRQYNPDDYKIQQIYPGRYKVHTPFGSHSSTLTSKKKAAEWIAWHKQIVAKVIRKNPGATNLAQYVQAAVDHTRGAHDEGGRVIHETPKSKRKEFAREIAFRKGYRSNPASAASALYKQFHGRGPDKIYEMQVAGIDPYGGHPELTSLGPLIRFIVGEDVVLGGEFGDEVKEAEWVREISFVPSVARWHDWLERIDPPTAEAKAKLREWKVPDLAAVPNTKQLYILGRQQGVTAQTLADMGSDPEKDLLDLGHCYLIEYFTQKRFDRFEPINYFHHFSEVSKTDWPRLIFDRVHGLLSLAGGAYRVTPRGIEN